MAFLLSLVDADDTISFLSGSYKLVEGGFDMGKPERREIWGGNISYGGGQSLIDVTYDNRVMQIVFNVTGSTRDALLANVARIEDLLYRCQEARIGNDYGYKTELQFRLDGATNISYFEILSGELEWPSDVMSIEQVHQKEGSGKYIVYDMTLTLIAPPFVDSISPVNGTPIQFAVTNHPYTTPTTSPVLGTTCEGPGEANWCNWVLIDESDIPGDAPGDLVIDVMAPLETHPVGGLRRVNFGLGRPFTGTKAAIYTMEAEDQNVSYPSQDPGAIAVTNTSASSLLTVPVTIGGGDVGNEIPLIHYEDVGSATGFPQGVYRFYHLFYPTTTFTAQFRLIWTRPGISGQTLEVGQYAIVTADDLTMVDLGIFSFPPNPVGKDKHPNTTGLVATLMGKFSGTGTVQLDCLLMVPVTEGMRVIETTPTTMIQYERIIDDGVNGVTYVIDPVNSRPYRNAIGYMPHLKLVPNTGDYLVTVLSERYDTTNEVWGTLAADTLGVTKFYYYPKYKSVVP